MRSIVSILAFVGASLVAPAVAAPPTVSELTGFWSGFCFQNVAYTLNNQSEAVYASLGDVTVGQAYTISYEPSRVTYWVSDMVQYGDNDEYHLDGETSASNYEYDPATGHVTQPECNSLSYDPATGVLTEIAVLHVGTAAGSVPEYSTTCPTATQVASAPSNSLSGNTFTIIYKCTTYKMGAGSGDDSAANSAVAAAVVVAASAASAIVAANL